LVSGYENLREGPLVSVIIPTKGESESTLRSCLTSLLRQSIPKELYEVIVVDYKPDGKSELEGVIGEFKERGLNVKLITIREEGIGKARNLGVRHSSRAVKYLVFMGADDRLAIDFLEGTLKAFSSNPYLAAIRYKVKPVTRYLKGFRGLLVRLMEEINVNLLPKFLINYLKLYYLPGWLFSCRKDIFEIIGGFSEEYNVGEDTDVGLKIRKYGIKLLKEGNREVPVVRFLGGRYWGEIGSKGLWRGILGYLACYVTYWAEEFRKLLTGKRVWRVHTVRL